MVPSGHNSWSQNVYKSPYRPASRSSGLSITEMSKMLHTLHFNSVEQLNTYNEDKSIPNGNGMVPILDLSYLDFWLNANPTGDHWKSDIISMIKCLKVQGWATTTNSRFEDNEVDLLVTTKLKGALTNAIYKLEYPGRPALLMRVFGSKVDALVDRKYELETLARLSCSNICAPTVYGCFENGRFERFLSEALTWTSQDMTDPIFSTHAAQKLKQLHCGVPLREKEILEGSFSWSKIHQWLNTMERVGAQWISKSDNIQNAFHCKDWETFRFAVSKYWEWLQSRPRMSSAWRKDVMVFSHNDLQHGNLMHLGKRNKKMNSIMLIDFEYSGPNLPEFDISNYLCECMHDYNEIESYHCNPKKYPSRQLVHDFLYTYLNYTPLNGSVNVVLPDLDTFYKSVLDWRPSAQLFWSIWAILQSGLIFSEDNSKQSQGEEDTFNYLGFAQDKMSCFWGDLIQLGVIDLDSKICIKDRVFYVDMNP